MPSLQDVWQQILALDTQYNNCRFPNRKEPAQRQLYLRRRSQLAREYVHQESAIANPSLRQAYYAHRLRLLAARYGTVAASTSVASLSLRSSRSRASSQRSLLFLNMDADLGEGSLFEQHAQTVQEVPKVVSGLRGVSTSFNSTDSNRLAVGKVVPTELAEASRALAGNESVGVGYAFTGIQHIFDHHTGPANRIRFANNDPTRLAIGSADGSLSVCQTWPFSEARILTVMKNHKGAIMDLAWSMANDFILTGSREGNVCLWAVERASCARTYEEKELGVGEVLACEFQPVNNNFFVIGGSKGLLQTVNLSTGKSVKGGRDRLNGSVTAVTFETWTGQCLWAGTSQGVIQSYKFEVTSGQLTRARRLTVAPQPPCPITGISARAWVSREARDPCLLVNAGMSALLFFRIVTPDGQLVLKNRFHVTHRPTCPHPIRSCFCPLISFREGACVVTGSEDGNVYVFDVTVGSVTSQKRCVTCLQGHDSAVLDVAISYDEKVLASSDAKGMVILWRRTNEGKS